MGRRRIQRNNDGTNGDSGISGDNAGTTVDDSGIPVFDPTADNNGTDTGTNSDSGTDTGSSTGIVTAKRRGRRPGTRNKTTSSPTNGVSLVGIEKLLLSLHAMGATFLNIPELAIEETEAKMLVDATAKVASHYTSDILSEKTVDILNLVMVAGAVYGPRAIVLWNKAKAEKPLRRMHIVHSAPVQTAAPDKPAMEPIGSPSSVFSNPTAGDSISL